MSLIDTNDARAHYDRGYAYYQKHEFDNAILAYTKAIELDPKFAFAYYARAMAYSALEDDDHRIDDLNKVIELSPDNIDAYMERADAYVCKAYVCKEFYNRAMDDLNKILEMDPNNDFAIKYRARLNIVVKNDSIDTAEEYEKIIETNSMDIESLFNLGTTYLLNHNFDNAIDYFNKVIELSPHYADAYYRRGKAFASKNYEKMTQENNYYKALEDYNNVMVNFNKAIENYNVAIELDPKNAHLYYELGVVYASMGDCEEVNHDINKANEYYDRAIENYDTAIEIEPDNAHIYGDRAIAYEKKSNGKIE